MNIQKTGWGEIRWQDEKTTILKNRKLQVGEVRLYAGNHQAKHLHYDEQVMYCLAGEAVSAINGEKEIGMTIISFIHKVRIEKSIYYMTVEKIPIKEIMEMVGYQNMNQFYKYFTKETGMTPAAYMKTR